MKKKIEMNIFIPLVLMFGILAFFSVASKGVMLTPANLRALFDQTFIVIIAGLGAIFVVAQGGTDMSVGTTMGMATVLSSTIIKSTGASPWLMFPIAIVVGLIQGLVNGFMVSKLKVPSFMTTLAMMIGMRGLINYIQSQVGLFYLPASFSPLKQFSFKIPVLIVLVIVAYYLMEYTKFGENSKAIGENEKVTISIGLPVRSIKTRAFIFSSVMAAIAGMFQMIKAGGTTNTMGTNMEIEVIMGICLGGVMVSGGYSARIEKLLIGSLTISIINNGLLLIGLTATQITESVRGIMLMLILFISIRFNDKELSFGGKKDKIQKAEE